MKKLNNANEDCCSTQTSCCDTNHCCGCNKESIAKFLRHIANFFDSKKD